MSAQPPSPPNSAHSTLPADTSPTGMPPVTSSGSGAAYYLPKVVVALRALGGVAKTSLVRNAIVDQMSAYQEVPDATELTSGEQKYQAEMRFARMYLVKAGKLEPTEVSGWGVWQLTPAGWDMPLDSQTAAALCSKAALTPDTQLLQESIQDVLPGVGLGDLEIRNLLLGLSDSGFERLCAAIMTANDAEAITVTGQAGDGGIDGTATFSVDSLALISFRVAWQCKKYAPNNKVQPNEIREFRGALDHGFQHGVFFTTSTFTLKAEEEARRAGQIPIKFIGLALLIKMLKDKELGLTKQPDQTFQINYPYFDKFKSKGTTGWTGKTLFSKPHSA